MAIQIATNFHGTPVTGATPISATFYADVVFTPSTQTDFYVSAYNWCFDNSASPKVWITTTEPTISNLFYGLYQQKFDVALSLGIAGTGVPIGDTSATSASYVMLGGVDQTKYNQNRYLSLTRFLPNKFSEGDVYIFTKFFEDYLNNMFDGTEGIVLSAGPTTQENSYTILQDTYSSDNIWQDTYDGTTIYQNNN